VRERGLVGLVQPLAEGLLSNEMETELQHQNERSLEDVHEKGTTDPNQGKAAEYYSLHCNLFTSHLLRYCPNFIENIISS